MNRVFTSAWLREFRDVLFGTRRTSEYVRPRGMFFFNLFTIDLLREMVYIVIVGAVYRLGNIQCKSSKIVKYHLVKYILSGNNGGNKWKLGTAEIEQLINSHPEIVSAVQFGSSISGDTYKYSDVNLLIVVEGEKDKVKDELRESLSWEYQTHIYSKEEFLQMVEKKEPLALSIIHTGEVLHNQQFVRELLRHKPNTYTTRRCMLNSFCALGIGTNDLFQGLMLYDGVNSLYHAARSSLWATLIEKEITPPNKRVFELMQDDEVKRRYKEVIAFRDELPDCEEDIQLDGKIWQEGGDVNKFTDILKKVNEIVKVTKIRRSSLSTG